MRQQLANCRSAAVGNFSVVAHTAQRHSSRPAVRHSAGRRSSQARQNWQKNNNNELAEEPSPLHTLETFLTGCFSDGRSFRYENISPALNTCRL